MQHLCGRYQPLTSLNKPPRGIHLHKHPRGMHLRKHDRGINLHRHHRGMRVHKHPRSMASLQQDHRHGRHLPPSKILTTSISYSIKHAHLRRTLTTCHAWHGQELLRITTLLQHEHGTFIVPVGTRHIRDTAEDVQPYATHRHQWHAHMLMPTSRLCFRQWHPRMLASTNGLCLRQCHRRILAPTSRRFHTSRLSHSSRVCLHQ